MKRNLILLATVLALWTAVASAQTISLKANVPFKFIVNRATMPAGNYIVQTLDAQGSVLSIRDQNSSAKGLIVSHSCRSSQAAKDTKLVFHRYGDRYFLKQVWVAGNTSGQELPPSPREKEVAMDFSMQEVVLMAAQR